MARTCLVYPPGVVGVPEPIARMASFPGGLGLTPDATQIDTMVVGQDFNSVKVYEQARREGMESSSRSATWRTIRSVFPRFGLTPEGCFFTNFYLGLREHGPETGRFPGARDQEFVRRCARFFERHACDRPGGV